MQCLDGQQNLEFLEPAYLTPLWKHCKKKKRLLELLERHHDISFDGAPDDDVLQNLSNSQDNEVLQNLSKSQDNEVPQNLEDAEGGEVPQNLEDAEGGKVPQNLEDAEGGEVPQNLDETQDDEAVALLQQRHLRIESNKSTARKGMRHQAESMLRKSSGRLPPSEVGTNVTIPIPEIDRSKGDEENVIDNMKIKK